MTERTAPRTWKIISSNSEGFPLCSHVMLKRDHPSSSRFDFLVDGEKLFDAELPDMTGPAGTAGTFRAFVGGQRPRFLAVTICPGRGADTRRHLCGRLFDPDREDEAVGVWVAEEQVPNAGDDT